MSYNSKSTKNNRQTKDLVQKKFVALDKEALQSASNSPQTLISLIQRYFPTLEFKQVYNKFKCLNASIEIIRAKSGDWIVRAWSNKFNVPSGGIEKVAMSLLGHSTTKGNQDAFFEVWQLVAKSAGLNFDDYIKGKGNVSPLNNSPKPTQPKPEIFKVNQGYELRQTYSYKTEKWGNAIGKSVLEYWREKIGTQNTNTADLQAFLQRYGIEPIKSVKHIEKGFVIGFTGNNFAFTYKVGQNIKGKRPNEKKYNKNFYVQSTGNYVFGYNQLPKTGKAVFFVGGESDCVAFNFHFNKLGYYAICINGENNNINSQLVKELQNRFDYVFTCYDNDKTGIESSIKNALVHGLPYIDLSDSTDLNDICEILQKQGFEEMKSIVLNGIITKSAIAKRSNDAFSIGVHNVLKLEINRFIGAEKEEDLKGLMIYEEIGGTPLELLKIYLLNYCRAMLKAQAGNGKTWALMQIAICAEYLKDLGVEQVIFCVPTTAIADQLKEDFQSRFEIDVPKITSKTTNDQIQESYHGQIIITTYDSLNKVDWKIKESLLIVDEFHELRNAKKYRNGACNEVFERMQIAKKVLAISATPLLELTTEKFNYQLITVNSKQTQKHTIQPIIYNEGTETDILQNRLKDFGTGNHIVKKNDVALLESWQQTTKQVYPNSSPEILSSKKSKYKDESPYYQSIIKSGELPKDTANFIGFVTSLMDAGTSLRFQVDSMTIVSPRCKDSLIQHMSRPRFLQKDGKIINEEIKVFTYHKAPQKDDLQVVGQKATNTLKSLQNAFVRAEIDAETANAQISSNKQANSKYLDDLSTIYYSTLSAKWEIDYLRILSNEYNRQMSLTTTEQFYQRVKAENPHIEILPFKYIDLEDDISTKLSLEEINHITREDREQALSVVVSDVVEVKDSFEGQELTTQSKGIELALSIVMNTTKSSKLKQGAKKAFELKDSQGNQLFTEVVDSELFKNDKDVYDNITKSANVINIDALEKPVSRFLSLLSLNISPEKIPNLLAENATDANFRWLKNMIVAQKEIKQFKADISKLSGKEIARVKKYSQISKAINRLSENRRTFSKERLRRFVGKAIGDPTITAERAIMRVSELYSTCVGGRGKDKTYTIGRILSRNSEIIELIK